MKKSLLNHKSLHFAILLLLLCANSVYSQTIITETFGTTANASYTGGTSTPSPSVSYTTNLTGYTSVATDANNTGFLNFVSNGTAKRVSVVGALPTGTGLNSNLHLNSNLITWTFNMKSSRASTNQFSPTTGYPENKYFNATVLCATNSSLLSNGATPGSGYAVTVQKSSTYATGTNEKISVNLIKFSNGIGNPVAPESSVVTRLIESPELAQIPTSVTTSNNLSIKVTYNPSLDVWQLFYREDPITPTPIGFVDPTSGDLTLGGSATDVPTTTAMTHFGYVVGLQTSTSAANTYQFDNFKITLSTPPAFTAPPTVEKRQAFNSTPTPTVSDLVATSNDGGTFNWYDAPTGGNLLSPSTPLTYSNYYVSQTVNSTESTRVATQVFVGDTALKTLPFHEDFSSYNTNDRLILINNNTLSGTGLGSWSVNAEATTPLSPDDVLIAAQPSSSWTSSVLPTPTGKAITFDKSGLDPQILFDAPTSGSVYASCLFMVTNLLSDSNNTSITAGTSGTSADTPKAPGHFFSLGYSAGAGQSTAYTAAVYLKTSTVDAAKFNIGINASPATTILADDIKWDATDYSVNTPITLVTSYSYDDYISRLWINPTDNSSEPTTANATTLPRTAALAVDRLRLTQQSSATTPFITLDEIRVANNWGEALGASSTLGITPVKSTGIKIYPNPVSNGKLYIASATNLEKEVAIYNTLGQEVLQSKTNNQAINVSNLSKGTYFVKITEAGITVTKKLIIQ